MARVPNDDFEHYYDPYADLMLAKNQIRTLQLERDEMFRAFENMVVRLKRLERLFDNKH